MKRRPVVFKLFNLFQRPFVIASADKVRNIVIFIVQYVYILRCKNNHPYIGCTDNLKERLERHNNGYVSATKELRPVKLIWYACFENKYLAFNFEKYLKTCSGRVLLNKRLIVSEALAKDFQNGRIPHGLTKPKVK